MPRKSKSPRSATPKPMTGPQRLNKLLAAAGLGSRRQVEQLIVDGRIEVDGQPVTDLATKVDPETAKVTFDGSAIKIFRPVYFALNKPVGVLSTNHDPSGRMRAIDLINVKERIFSAGRLDRSSEGLMLLTNDGELVQRLSHPRFGVQKLYLATVQGEITQVDLEKLVRGVRLAEGYAKVDAAKLRRQRSGAAELEIVLSEGKNREIRRILARLGHKVVALKRLAIGPLRLGLLPTGGWRPLTRHEIDALYAAAATGRRKRRGTVKPRSTTKKPQPGMLVAGEFDEFFEDDPELTPSLDEQVDELGDDEIVPVMAGDSSIVGTVLGYDEDDDLQADDTYGDDESADQSLGDSYRTGRSSRPSRKTAGRTSGPRASGPRGRSKSPHDLRNRSSATGSAPGVNRSSNPGAKKRSSSKTGPSRGSKKSGGRAASRDSAPKLGSRSGRPKSGSGPRSDRPKSSRPKSGRPISSKPKSSRRSGGSGGRNGPRG